MRIAPCGTPRRAPLSEQWTRRVDCSPRHRSPSAGSATRAGWPRRDHAERVSRLVGGGVPVPSSASPGADVATRRDQRYGEQEEEDPGRYPPAATTVSRILAHARQADEHDADERAHDAKHPGEGTQRHSDQPAHLSRNVSRGLARLGGPQSALPPVGLSLRRAHVKFARGGFKQAIHRAGQALRVAAQPREERKQDRAALSSGSSLRRFLRLSSACAYCAQEHQAIAAFRRPGEGESCPSDRLWLSDRCPRRIRAAARAADGLHMR
jgi:hypothetical protein